MATDIQAIQDWPTAVYPIFIFDFRVCHDEQNRHLAAYVFPLGGAVAANPAV